MYTGIGNLALQKANLNAYLLITLALTLVFRQKIDLELVEFIT